MPLSRQNLALISPLKWFRHSAIKVVDKVKDARFEIIFAGKACTLEQLTHKNAKPNLNLIEPRGIFGCVIENNPMCWIAQKCCLRCGVPAGGSLQQGRHPCLHRFENTTFAFDAKVNV